MHFIKKIGQKQITFVKLSHDNNKRRIAICSEKM